METTNIAVEDAAVMPTEDAIATNDGIILDVVFITDAVTIATDATSTDDNIAADELVVMDAVVMATDDATRPEYATSRDTHFSASSCER